MENTEKFLCSPRLFSGSMMLRLVIYALLVGCSVTGCSRQSSPIQKQGAIDLLSLIPEHNQAGSPEAMRYAFARDGQNRQTITLQANSKVALRTLVIPDHAEMTFALAMPFNLGDGAVARVYFRGGGRERLLFERRLDPSRRREDRKWQQVSVDLSEFAGKTGEIVLQAAGETGELTGDWIGWGDPMIRVRRQHGTAQRQKNVSLVNSY